MNGAEIKKAVINKAKQTIAEVQGSTSNGSSSSNQQKKRRKQDLKPIITSDKDHS